jgi:hypothetical protein
LIGSRIAHRGIELEDALGAGADPLGRMRHQTAEQVRERLLRAVVELRLVAKEDHPMGEQCLAHRADLIRRHRAAKLDPENFSADPPAEPADFKCLRIVRHLRLPSAATGAS